MAAPDRVAQRQQWMEQASQRPPPPQIKCQVNPPSASPIPALTAGQAKQLVSVCGFASDVLAFVLPNGKKFGDAIAEQIVRFNSAKDPHTRRPFETLFALAKHECSTYMFDSSVLRRRIEDYKVLSKNPDETPETLQEIWDVSVYQYALSLEEGYDHANHEQYLCNVRNQIIGVVPQMETRVPDACKRRIEEDTTARSRAVWRPNPFTDGGKKHRKTKKRTKKSKKTLRRK